MDYRFGDYTLDTERYELRRAGVLVKLRPKVFEVLAYLIAHRDRLVAKQELLEQLWPQQFVGETTLSSCIRAVRQAVGDTGRTQQVIQTRHGRGFRFVAEIAGDDQERLDSAGHLSPAMARHVAPQGNPTAHGLVVPEDQERAEVELLTAAVVEVEHKAVTVLSAGLVDAATLAAQPGPEAMHHLMQACLATAQRVMPQYGGTLTHITGEGFVALFGAPLAHEDHARRAVLAAVALQQALQERHVEVSQPVPLSVGVHTGPVVVGGLGDERHRLYTAMSQTLEIANRLRQLAVPGAVLLSAATQQLVQAEVQVGEGGTLGVAGEAALGPVYEVRQIIRRRSGVLGHGGRALSRFVGRGREVAMLHERLRHAAQGQGQGFGIAGEPGIGKSRLLYEFRQRLSDQPVTYCEGHCLAYGHATPYLPVQDLVRQLCEIAEADGPEAITKKVHAHLQAVGMAPADEAPYLLQVLGVAAETDTLARLSPQAIRARTFASLQQVCLASSRRQALILAVENLHWSDPTSEEWLTTLVERIAGAAILLLVTYRPGYRPAWLERSYATQLALPRLTADDSLALVQSVPQAERLPDSLRQAIVAKAAGNPFFLEELTRAVGDHGREQAPLSIPDTIQAVLTARIDRLPTAAKRLLQAAAVIGVQASVPLLQAIAAVPADILAECLQHVQAAELLYETRVVPEPEYTFSHALTQEVAYGSLLHEGRRAIHAQIVDAFERFNADRLFEYVEQLAHHALHGELWDKAFAYYRQAADKAMGRSAYREVIICCEQALVALRHLTAEGGALAQGIDLLRELYNALVQFGEFGRGLEYLREAETLANALGDHRRLGQILTSMTHSFCTVGDYEDAITCGQRALALTATSGDLVHQAMVQGYLGTVYFYLGGYRRAIDVLRQALTAFEDEWRHERFGMSMLHSVRVRTWLMDCLRELGDFAEGRACGEDAVRIAGAAGHVGSTLMPQERLGSLALVQGDLPRAISLLEHALAQCHAAHVPLYVPAITACLGLAYALSGRGAEALTLIEPLQIRDTPGMGGSAQMLRLGEAYLWAAHFNDASRLAERALKLCSGRKERGSQARALRLLG
jgi:class 3 adenylate cyclase/tetratricopeptide (TPR) repeat protein